MGWVRAVPGMAWRASRKNVLRAAAAHSRRTISSRFECGSGHRPALGARPQLPAGPRRMGEAPAQQRARGFAPGRAKPRASQRRTVSMSWLRPTAKAGRDATARSSFPIDQGAVTADRESQVVRGAVSSARRSAPRIALHRALGQQPQAAAEHTDGQRRTDRTRSRSELRHSSQRARKKKAAAARSGRAANSGRPAPRFPQPGSRIHCSDTLCVSTRSTRRPRLLEELPRCGRCRHPQSVALRWRIGIVKIGIPRGLGSPDAVWDAGRGQQLFQRIDHFRATALGARTLTRTVFGRSHATSILPLVR